MCSYNIFAINFWRWTRYRVLILCTLLWKFSCEKWQEIARIGANDGYCEIVATCNTVPIQYVTFVSSVRHVGLNDAQGNFIQLGDHLILVLTSKSCDQSEASLEAETKFPGLCKTPVQELYKALGHCKAPLLQGPLHIPLQQGAKKTFCSRGFAKHQYFKGLCKAHV